MQGEIGSQTASILYTNDSVCIRNYVVHYVTYIVPYCALFKQQIRGHLT